MNAPAPKPNPVTRWAVFLALGGIAIALAHLLDRTALLTIHDPDTLNHDWGRLLRVAGYVPTWLLVAAVFALIDSGRSAASITYPLRDKWSRAATLVSSVLLAGLLAELTKALVRRQRPDLDIAGYTFRPYWQDPWSTSGLGMPSGHTAVAFGAAAILCRLHPRATPIWLGIATGCAATRLLAQAHYLSDTVAGAVVGLTAGAIIWSLHLRITRKRSAPA